MKFVSGDEVLRALKQALGLPLELPVQKIVVEAEAGMLPRVYVKGLVTRGFAGAAAGALEVVPVADVTVDDAGNVGVTPP